MEIKHGQVWRDANGNRFAIDDDQLKYTKYAYGRVFWLKIKVLNGELPEKAVKERKNEPSQGPWMWHEHVVDNCELVKQPASPETDEHQSDMCQLCESEKERDGRKVCADCYEILAERSI